MSSEIIDIDAPIFISIGILHSSTRKLIFSGGNLPCLFNNLYTLQRVFCITPWVTFYLPNLSQPPRVFYLQVPTVAFLNLHTSNSSGPFWHSSDKFCPCVCTLPFHDWLLHSNSSSLNLTSQLLATNPVNRFLLVGGICSFNVVHDAVFLSPLNFFLLPQHLGLFPRSLCMLT